MNENDEENGAESLDESLFEDLDETEGVWRSILTRIHLQVDGSFDAYRTTLGRDGVA
jgi:hypothetical protein